MTRWILVLSLASLTLITGCATSNGSAFQPREVNGEHVATVERAARTAGVRVLWINPPTRVSERELEYSTRVEFERNKATNPE